MMLLVNVFLDTTLVSLGESILSGIGR